VEETLDKLQIFVKQYRIYHHIKWILNMGIEIYNNLPAFMKRT